VTVTHANRNVSDENLLLISRIENQKPFCMLRKTKKRNRNTSKSQLNKILGRKDRPLGQVLGDVEWLQFHIRQRLDGRIVRLTQHSPRCRPFVERHDAER
jgi:hypothetical protein